MWLAAAALIVASSAITVAGRFGDSERALPAANQRSTDDAALQVFALGRLAPAGELRAMAAPFGSGDARVASLFVEEGQAVKRGDPLALFDNVLTLESALAVAERQLLSRQAALAQAERAVSFSKADSDAALSRADVSLNAAEVELQRWQALLELGFISPAAVDQRKAQRDQAVEERRRANALLARHAGSDDQQPDLVVARRGVELAKAERDRARKELDRATLRAPSDGTVIAIHVRPGERPGAAGVLDFGDTRVMTAELELYQDDVPRVKEGLRVRLTSKALNESLTGHISHLGVKVGRQRITDASPAANVDARVVRATVLLDAASSDRARTLVGLEVQAKIAVSSP